jgi:hypothetical protein
LPITDSLGREQYNAEDAALKKRFLLKSTSLPLEAEK